MDLALVARWRRHRSSPRAQTTLGVRFPGDQHGTWAFLAENYLLSSRGLTSCEGGRWSVEAHLAGGEP